MELFKMAALDGEGGVRGLLNIGNIVIQPERIENAFRNDIDSSWTYLVRWKDIWLHETLCINFANLVDDYWKRQANTKADNESGYSVSSDIVGNEISEVERDVGQMNEFTIAAAMNDENVIAADMNLISSCGASEVNDNADVSVHPEYKQPVDASLDEDITTVPEARKRLIQALHDQGLHSINLQPINSSTNVTNVVIESMQVSNIKNALPKKTESTFSKGKRLSNILNASEAVGTHDTIISPSKILKTISDSNAALKAKIDFVRKEAPEKVKSTAVKCDLCDKVLSSRNSLREHRITVHFKNGKFVCEQCGKRFSHRRALRMHEVMHTNERNFVCPECGNAHKRQRDLKLHIRDMHMKVSNYRCDVCFSCFKLKGQLKKHCFTEHEQTVTNCIVCNHKLSTPFSIYMHCLKHLESREFKCEKCDSAFKQEKQLVKHMEIHDPNRMPYKNCPKCHKDIFSRSHYYEHVRSHDLATNEILRIKCDFCDASFQHLSSQKRHMLRHRPGGDLEHPKENPYLNMDESELPPLCCRLCRKYYTSTSGYYDHIKRCRDGYRTEEICPFCNKTYSSKKTLTRHMKQLHADELVAENLAITQVICESTSMEEVEETPQNDAESEEIAIQIIALAPAIEEEVRHMVDEGKIQVVSEEETIICEEDDDSDSDD